MALTDTVRLDPAAAARSRQRYRCFEGFRKDPQIYARTVAAQPKRSCQRQAAEELLEVQAWLDAGTLPPAQQAELFSVVQNARVVENGEAYFRLLSKGGRLVGVVYKPLEERRMHYFQGSLAQQFDAVVHIDETEAVRPLTR